MRSGTQNASGEILVRDFHLENLNRLVAAPHETPL
jgi:hypothetical protein